MNSPDDGSVIDNLKEKKDQTIRLIILSIKDLRALFSRTKLTIMRVRTERM